MTSTAAPREENPERHSGYLITISTNVRPKNDREAEEVSDCLRDTLEELLEAEGLREVIDFRKRGHKFTSDFVDDVNSEFVIEIGRMPRGRRVHAHVLIMIKHRSNLRLDYTKLRNFINRALGDGRCSQFVKAYVNVRLLKGVFDIRKYLRKELKRGSIQFSGRGGDYDDEEAETETEGESDVASLATILQNSELF
jgi:hypothetical protein